MILRRYLDRGKEPAVPRRGYGVRIVVLLVCAGVLALDLNWCRSTLPGGFLSLAGYVSSAAILLVAMIGVSVALTPSVAWRALALVFVIAIGWGVAALLGSMFAECDVNMRPFFGELLLQLPMGILIQNTRIIEVVAFSVLAALVAWGTTKVFRHRTSSWLFVGVLAAVPVVFFLTTMALSARGTHPVAGNCVI